MVSVSIVVPTNKSIEQVEGLLSSLAVNCASLENVELIIVTNGSGAFQKSSYLVERISKILNPDRLKVQSCPRENANAARNLGARLAKGEFVFFLDDDCQLQSIDSLNSLVDLFLLDPSLAGVGGGYTSANNPSVLALSYNWITNSWLKFREDQVLVGGNCLYRKRLFIEAGGFNEEFSGSAEEIDLNLYLAARGFAVKFKRDFFVEHRFAGSLKRFFARAFEFGRIRFAFRRVSYLRAPLAVWQGLKGSGMFDATFRPIKLPAALALFIIFYMIILVGRMTSIGQGVPVYNRPLID